MTGPGTSSRWSLPYTRSDSSVETMGSIPPRRITRRAATPAFDRAQSVGNPASSCGSV